METVIRLAHCSTESNLLKLKLGTEISLDSKVVHPNDKKIILHVFFFFLRKKDSGNMKPYRLTKCLFVTQIWLAVFTKG